MEDYRLGEVERRFADLIWANAPLPSGELVRLCQGSWGGRSPPPIPCSSACAKRACLSTTTAR